MEQNPYAQPDAYAQTQYMEPQKTSIAAVLGLISSLIGCCLPIGILGVLLGVFGLVGIGRSNGRVGGRGIAIAAIIIGLLTTVLWVGGVAMGLGGVNVFVNKIIAPTGQAIADIESGDYTAFRATMGANTTAITDADLDAFRSAYQGEVGSFVSVPSSLGELWGGYVKLGQIMQGYQSGSNGNEIPFPATFQNGPGLIVLKVNKNQTTPSGMPLPEDLMIVSPDGTEVRLSHYVSGDASAIPAATPDEAPAPSEP